ncbi:hypothetical protein EMCRGX_G027433 [Ephydatia muelleri]
MSSEPSAVPRIKIPVKCQPPTPVVEGSKICYKCQPVQKLVQCSAHEVTQEDDPPVLNGTPNEPCCPHCLFGPCIIRRPPVFLTGRAVPSLANDRKWYKLYQQFWKLVKDLGLWDHPTYLARKGLVTHPLDRREIMPKCVQNVNDPTFVLENVLCYIGNQKQVSKSSGHSLH